MATKRPGGPARLAGRPIARLGYGTMRLAHGAHAPSREDAIAVLRDGVDLGINHFDTAAFYGDDVANTLIRDALSPYPDGLVLATKVGARIGSGGGLVCAQRPEELRADVEHNLRTLGVERIDVVNLRRCDAAPGIIATGDQVVDIDAQLAELAAMRDEGKVGGIGLSAVSAHSSRHLCPPESSAFRTGTA